MTLAMMLSGFRALESLEDGQHFGNSKTLAWRLGFDKDPGGGAEDR